MNHRKIYVNGPIRNEIVSTARTIEELVQEVRDNLNYYRSTDVFERFLQEQESADAASPSATDGPEHEAELETACVDQYKDIKCKIQQHKDLKTEMYKLYHLKQQLEETPEEELQHLQVYSQLVSMKEDDKPQKSTIQEYIEKRLNEIDKEQDDIEKCLAKNIPIPIDFYDNHLLKITPEKYVFDDLPLILFATPKGYFPVPYISNNVRKHFIAMLKGYIFNHNDSSKEGEKTKNDNEDTEAKMTDEKAKFMNAEYSHQTTYNSTIDDFETRSKILSQVFAKKNKANAFRPVLGIINNTDYSFSTTDILEYSFDDIDIEVQNVMFKYYQYFRDNIVFYLRCYHTVVIMNPALIESIEGKHGLKRTKPFGNFIDDFEKENDSWLEKLILTSKIICETSGVQHKSILTDEIPNDYFCDFHLHSIKQDLVNAIKENKLVLNHPKYQFDIAQEVIDKYKAIADENLYDTIAITEKVEKLMGRFLVIIKLSKTEKALYDFHAELKKLSIEEVFLLLNAKSSKYTLLHYAIFCANEPAINFLLALYPSLINIGKEYSPLQLAVHRKKIRVVKLLLEYGPEVNAQNTGGRIALHYAARNGDCEMINLLLTYKSNVNVYSFGNFKTPLIEAPTVKVMELLVNHGASIEMNDYNYLYNRRSIDDVSVCKRLNFLLDWSEKKSKRYPSYILDSALSSVCDFTLYQYKDKFDYQCAVSLLNHGADPNSPDISKRLTPLQYIVGTELREFNGVIYEFVKLLLQKKAKVEVKDGCDQTPLMWCVKRGDYKTAFLLAMHGAIFPEAQLDQLAARISANDKEEFEMLKGEFNSKNQKEAAESQRGITKLIEELGSTKKKSKKKKQRKTTSQPQRMQGGEPKQQPQEKSDEPSNFSDKKEPNDGGQTNGIEASVVNGQIVLESAPGDEEKIQSQATTQGAMPVIDKKQPENSLIHSDVEGVTQKIEQEKIVDSIATTNGGIAASIDNVKTSVVDVKISVDDIVSNEQEKTNFKNGSHSKLMQSNNETRIKYQKRQTNKQEAKMAPEDTTKSAKTEKARELYEEQLKEIRALRLEQDRTAATMKLYAEKFSALQDEIAKKNVIIAQMKDLLLKAQEKIEKTETDAHIIQDHQQKLLNDAIIENNHLRATVAQPISELQKYKELYMVEKERADRLAESLAYMTNLKFKVARLKKMSAHKPTSLLSPEQQMSPQPIPTLSPFIPSDFLSSPMESIDNFFLIKHPPTTTTSTTTSTASTSTTIESKIPKNSSDKLGQEQIDFSKPFSF